MNKIELASEPTTSPEILDELSTDIDADVRMGVAENPNTQNYLIKYINYSLL
jgi:hypothetical protein